MKELQIRLLENGTVRITKFGVGDQVIEVDKDLIIVKNHWSDTAENSFKVIKMAMTIVNINNEKI